MKHINLQSRNVFIKCSKDVKSVNVFKINGKTGPIGLVRIVLCF